MRPRTTVGLSTDVLRMMPTPMPLAAGQRPDAYDIVAPIGAPRDGLDKPYSSNLLITCL
jgi:hypothetical protein